MQYWLMKSEPDVFSWDDLVRQGKAEWDGVRNHAAQLNMKAMKLGDRALFYHSNIGLECVGIMQIVGEAQQDTTDETGKWKSVLVAPVEPLPSGVTLKAIKAEPRLAQMAMIRQSRLSVSPVAAEEYAVILEMAGAKG
ncbi:MAG: EVE domain-containing protein [Sphingobium sp.]|nr:EVE domain-containing protein [Sphingobium sp.]